MPDPFEGLTPLQRRLVNTVINLEAMHTNTGQPWSWREIVNHMDATPEDKQAIAAAMEGRQR